MKQTIKYIIILSLWANINYPAFAKPIRPGALRKMQEIQQEIENLRVDNEKLAIDRKEFEYLSEDLYTMLLESRANTKFFQQKADSLQEEINNLNHQLNEAKEFNQILLKENEKIRMLAHQLERQSFDEIVACLLRAECITFCHPMNHQECENDMDDTVSFLHEILSTCFNRIAND